MKRGASFDISAIKNKMLDKKRDMCFYMVLPSVLNVPTWLAKNLNFFYFIQTYSPAAYIQAELRVRLRFRKLT